MLTESKRRIIGRFRSLTDTKKCVKKPIRDHCLVESDGSKRQARQSEGLGHYPLFAGV